MKKLAVAHLKVSDVMIHSVFTVHPFTTIKEAIKALLDNKISGAPLIDPKTKEVITVVSEADLMKLAASNDMNSILLAVIDKLPDPKSVISIRPEAPYADVFKLFLTNNIRRVIVTDAKGVLVGVVSRRDIIRSMLEEEDKT